MASVTLALTASILLSQASVTSLLVERHPGTAVHPKARGINGRTMEIYHQCGVEAAVRAAGLPPEHTGMIIWAQTLAGEEIERRVPWRAGPPGPLHHPGRSPGTGGPCPYPLGPGKLGGERLEVHVPPGECVDRVRDHPDRGCPRLLLRA